MTDEPAAAPRPTADDAGSALTPDREKLREGIKQLVLDAWIGLKTADAVSDLILALLPTPDPAVKELVGRAQALIERWNLAEFNPGEIDNLIGDLSRAVAAVEGE